MRATVEAFSVVQKDVIYPVVVGDADAAQQVLALGRLAAHGGALFDAERAVGTHCLGALDEQADCVAGVGEPLRRGHLLGGSDEERWHRELVLTADA